MARIGVGCKQGSRQTVFTLSKGDFVASKQYFVINIPQSAIVNLRHRNILPELHILSIMKLTACMSQSAVKRLIDCLI